MKKIRNLITLLIILIIILTCSLIYIIKNRTKSEGIQYETQIVSKTDEYILIAGSIQEYYGYISDEEYDEAYSLLDKEYISNYALAVESLKKERDEKYTNFIPQKIYSCDIDKYSKIYFVKGLLYKVTKEKAEKNNQNETGEMPIYKLDELEQREYKNDVYYIVKYDSINKTFSISRDIEKYKNAFDSNYINIVAKKEKEDKDTKEREYNIEPNENNKIFEYTIQDEMFCWMLLNNFREYYLYNPEEAYKFLNEEYRTARFKNLEGFKEYIQDSLNTIQGSYISKYVVKKYDDYIEYILLDQNENYYNFKCYGGYNYEVKLDNYTLPTQTYLASYINGDAEYRVITNIRKFIEMINSKDYLNAYEKLAENFKKNKFQDKDTFKKFIKENMYEYNEIEFEEFKEQGNIYIYNIKLTEKDAPAHPAKNMQILMELGEGIDFKLSFNIE